MHCNNILIKLHFGVRAVVFTHISREQSCNKITFFIDPCSNFTKGISSCRVCSSISYSVWDALTGKMITMAVDRPPKTWNTIFAFGQCYNHTDRTVGHCRMHHMKLRWRRCLAMFLTLMCATENENDIDKHLYGSFYWLWNRMECVGRLISIDETHIYSPKRK